MGKIGCVHLVIALLPLLLLQWSSSLASAGSSSGGTDDGSEQWGYVEVRPKAHLFWWLYKSPNRVEDLSSPWPTILWLQGGPGGSGVGFGNFLELGPLDGDLQPRNFTWLRKADLLFVDSPVGTGFSYVEDESLAVKTDDESATDLTTLLKALYNDNDALQKSPLYIFAESYGGKFAVTLGVTAVKAIEAGELRLRLGGVALGDSWISPEHFTSSWGPLLKQVSRISNNGLSKSNSVALKIKQQLAEGQYENATESWNELEGVISEYSDNVDIYNFLYGAEDSPLVATNKVTTSRVRNAAGKYTSGLISMRKRLSSSPSSSSILADQESMSLDDLMNGPIRKKLKIIPPNVTWGGQGDLVFSAMTGDFMRPRIKEVPVEQPCISLQMVGTITQSPNKA
ncbi:Serine carboxypeptidase-like 51 [Linum grandiflorum]